MRGLNWLKLGFGGAVGLDLDLLQRCYLRLGLMRNRGLDVRHKDLTLGQSSLALVLHL